MIFTSGMCIAYIGVYFVVRTPPPSYAHQYVGGSVSVPSLWVWYELMACCAAGASAGNAGTVLPDSGGYDAEIFVESPPDSMLCPICYQVLREPQMVHCCSEKFCEPCIQRVRLAGRPCPMCRTDGFQVMAERKLRGRIMDLAVFCRNRDSGCHWQGELRALNQHTTSDCSYQVLPCQHGCGARLQRCQLAEHEKRCCAQALAGEEGGALSPLEQRLEKRIDQALRQQQELYERQMSSLRTLVAEQVQRQCDLLLRDHLQQVESLKGM